MKRLVERGWMLPLDDSRLPRRKNTMPEYDSPDNGVQGCWSSTTAVRVSVWPMKLWTRLPALLLPMTLVPLFLVAFIAYLSLQKVSIAQGGDELEQLTDGVAATIKTHLEISRGHLAAIASDPLLQACLEAPPSVRDDLYIAPLIRKWKQFRQQYAGFGRMQLLDEQGQVLVDDEAQLDPAPLVPASSLTDAGRAPGVFVIPPLSGAHPELLLIQKIDFMAHPTGGRPHRAHAWLVTMID